MAFIGVLSKTGVVAVLHVEGKKGLPPLQLSRGKGHVKVVRDGIPRHDHDLVAVQEPLDGDGDGK